MVKAIAAHHSTNMQLICYEERHLWRLQDEQLPFGELQRMLVYLRSHREQDHKGHLLNEAPTRVLAQPLLQSEQVCTHLELVNVDLTPKTLDHIV